MDQHTPAAPTALITVVLAGLLAGIAYRLTYTLARMLAIDSTKWPTPSPIAKL